MRDTSTVQLTTQLVENAAQQQNTFRATNDR